MKKQRALITALLFVVFLSVLCSCSRKKVNVPEQSDVFYVYDEANVLDAETEAYIVGKNVDLYEKCGGQIVVACVKTTGNYDIKDYAYAVFNKWKIGSADKNNGVLILLSIDEDDYWVLQGNGLESLLQSGTLKLMLNDYLEPHFAKKEYAEGVRALFDALINKYEQIYSVTVVQAEHNPGAVLQPAETSETGETAAQVSFWSVITVIASVVVGFAILVVVLVIIVSIVVTVFIIFAAAFGGGSGGGAAKTFRSSGGININPHSFRPSGTFRHTGSTFSGSFRPGGFSGHSGGSSSGHSGGFTSGRTGGFSSGRSGGFSSGRSGGGFSGGHHSGGGGFSRGGGAGRR